MALSSEYPEGCYTKSRRPGAQRDDSCAAVGLSSYPSPPSVRRFSLHRALPNPMNSGFRGTSGALEGNEKAVLHERLSNDGG